jgi:hypothetical protein
MAQPAAPSQVLPFIANPNAFNLEGSQAATERFAAGEFNGEASPHAKVMLVWHNLSPVIAHTATVTVIKTAITNT